MLALEYLRLAADEVRATRERGGDSARATATLRDRLAVVATLAHATDPAPAPPIRPAWPALAVPTAPSRGLAVVARDGVELAVLEVRRPYVPAEGPPADPSLEYLVVRFRLTNEGASDVPYFTLSDFALRLPDGREVPPLALGEADRYETGTLAPGDTLIANVAYLVRHGAMPLVLRFAPAAGPAMETALP